MFIYFPTEETNEVQTYQVWLVNTILLRMRAHEISIWNSSISTTCVIFTVQVNRGVTENLKL